MESTSTKVVWEAFIDPGYFDMWAVCPVGETDFNSPRLYHVVKEEDARTLVDILNRATCSVRRT